ncbi:hypothetical protein EDC01DRAFT_609728 [Geopyxis carbonaria]|nr:hypothetical protein EDC01DRAFT_609728 [Geopyxis carbonaria]
MKPPQALATTYSARLGTFATALLGPAAGAVQAQVVERRTKRGTTAVNYSEDAADDIEHHAPDSAAAAASAGDPNPFAITRPEKPFAMPAKLVHRPLGGHYRSDAQLTGAAQLPTTLIPIRLDLDLPAGRLHDTFLWNLHEALITPEAFASTMAADLDLPPHCVPTIIAAITDQLAEYAPVASITLPESSGEMRAVCRLTVNLDDIVYTDTFEWDLTNTHLPPEHFARLVAADLGLRAEFIPAIAAAIYEFALQRKKDLYDAGLPELDHDPGWRVDAEQLCLDWEPRVEVLTRDEIEKREIDREREIRRLRRETARFGTAAATAPAELDSDLGRGGRGRVRKRQRSLSPTPMDGEWERRGWRCGWCGVPGMGTWGAGEGPEGNKTLCANCSHMWKTGVLAEWNKGMHMR